MINSAILIIQCRDQKGIVAAVSGFLHQYNGNILEIDQHIDEESGHFFMRAKWELSGFSIDKDSISATFSAQVGDRFNMKFRLHFDTPKPKMAIFVSNLSHCLFDILRRHYSGEFQVEIPLVISNHETLQPVVEGFAIPFFYLPITPQNKEEQEKRQL